MPSPFTWDLNKPAGADAIKDGDDQIRTDKTTLRDVLRTLGPFGAPTVGWRNVQIDNDNYLTENAKWTGSQWDRDDIAVPATAIRYNATDGTMEILRAIAAANPITWFSAGFLAATDYRLVDIADEFMSRGATDGIIGALGWSLSGGGTITVQTAVGVGHPGVMRLASTASSGNITRTFLEDVEMDELLYMAAIVRPQDTALVEYRFGSLTTSDTAGGTDAIMFEYTGSGNWRCKTRAASTTTDTDSTVAVTATNWYLLEMRRLSNGNWQFWINGVLRATHSTNIPTTPNPNIGLVVETGAAAAKSIDIDWFALRSRLLGQRWT